ncbi:hypothetical protein DRQ33_02095 [bacterium]|nr:MAG: hypothetical protein DRQ33_02095 [bacterium]
MKNKSKILIIALKGLGNTVCLTNSLKYIDDSNMYDIDIAVCNNGSYKYIETLELNNINNIYIWDINKPRAIMLFDIISKIRRNRYHSVYCTYPSGAKEVLSLFFSRSANKKIIRNKGGYIRFAQFLFPRAPQSDPSVHEVENNATLMGVPIHIIRNKSVDIKSINRSKIGLHIGSRGIGKRWDLSRWTSLMELLHSEFKSNFVIMAGKDEKYLVEKLRNNSSLQFDTLIGAKFDTLINTIRDLALLIGNDSSIGHIAAIYGIPTISIWAYSEYERISPYGKGAIIITRDYDCIPCYNVTKQYIRKCKYDFRCIKDTTIEEVYEIARKYIYSLKSGHIPDIAEFEKMDNVSHIKQLPSGAKIIFMK